jgi:hypothetical protein
MAISVAGAGWLTSEQEDKSIKDMEITRQMPDVQMPGVQSLGMQRLCSIFFIGCSLSV